MTFSACLLLIMVRVLPISVASTVIHMGLGFGDELDKWGGGQGERLGAGERRQGREKGDEGREKGEKRGKETIQSYIFDKWIGENSYFML